MDLFVWFGCLPIWEGGWIGQKRATENSYGSLFFSSGVYGLGHERIDSHNIWARRSFSPGARKRSVAPMWGLPFCLPASIPSDLEHMERLSCSAVRDSKIRPWTQWACSSGLAALSPRNQPIKALWLVHSFCSPFQAGNQRY